MKGIIFLALIAGIYLPMRAQSTLEVLDFGKEIKLKDVISVEEENGCVLKPAPFIISLGSEYYPNLNNYQLLNPLVAVCKSSTGLDSETEYFYTEDSIVRALLTTWFTAQTANAGLKKEDALVANKLAFQDKLTELQNILITQLGQPYVAGQHYPYDATSERIEYKWKGKYNAYLSVVFSKDLGYSRLRLAIYKD